MSQTKNISCLWCIFHHNQLRAQLRWLWTPIFSFSVLICKLHRWLHVSEIIGFVRLHSNLQCIIFTSRIFVLYFPRSIWSLFGAQFHDRATRNRSRFYSRSVFVVRRRSRFEFVLVRYNRGGDIHIVDPMPTVVTCDTLVVAPRVRTANDEWTRPSTLQIIGYKYSEIKCQPQNQKQVFFRSGRWTVMLEIFAHSIGYASCRYRCLHK